VAFCRLARLPGGLEINVHVNCSASPSGSDELVPSRRAMPPTNTSAGVDISATGGRLVVEKVMLVSLVADPSLTERTTV
jgi:hypothetical protein